MYMYFCSDMHQQLVDDQKNASGSITQDLEDILESESLYYLHVLYDSNLGIIIAIS